MLSEHFDLLQGVFSGVFKQEEDDELDPAQDSGGRDETAVRVLSCPRSRRGALAARQAPAQRRTPAVETWEQYQGPEAEKFLKEARVGMKALGTGVTLPQKAELLLDGVTPVRRVQDDRRTRPGITQFDEGAAEELPGFLAARGRGATSSIAIIGLKRVPATIERTSTTNRIAAVVGQEPVFRGATAESRREAARRKPGRGELNMDLFDQLIANVDRHLNNILITEDFDLRLIDHSRSFRAVRGAEGSEAASRASRALLEGIQKLEYQDLRKKVGRYLDEQIKTMLVRRDLILKLVDKLIKERGEAAVLYQLPPAALRFAYLQYLQLAIGDWAIGDCHLPDWSIAAELSAARNSQSHSNRQ